MTEKTENNFKSGEQEISLTDILQAHDILISILLGKTLAKYDKPALAIAQMLQMVEMQEINDNAKAHIKLLLKPLEESLK